MRRIAKLKNIIASLDSIADSVQASNKEAAAEIDVVSNTLDVLAKRSASFKSDLDSHPEYLEGASASDEAGNSDQFEAKNFHKVPVGDHGVFEYAKGEVSVSGILNELDLEGDHKIHIQSKTAKGAVEGVAEDVDMGDEKDPYTTQGLETSGDEKAVDDGQEGQSLELFSGKQQENANNPRAKVSKAMRVLKAAAEISVESPKDLHTKGAGNDVERDHGVKGQPIDESFDVNMEVLESDLDLE